MHHNKILYFVTEIYEKLLFNNASLSYHVIITGPLITPSSNPKPQTGFDCLPSQNGQLGV